MNNTISVSGEEAINNVFESIGHNIPLDNKVWESIVKDAEGAIIEFKLPSKFVKMLEEIDTLAKEDELKSKLKNVVPSDEMTKAIKTGLKNIMKGYVVVISHCVNTQNPQPVFKFNNNLGSAVKLATVKAIKGVL